MERLSTGVPTLDVLIEGGIPRKFFVAVVGEPGTGKTILCIHFIARGIADGDKSIYITTEESRESIITQAKQFNIDFEKAIAEKKLILIDALMGGQERWNLKSLTPDELIETVINAKKELGYGKARVVIDSLSAFWLDRPAMARRYAYYFKKVFSKWDFTIMATSQYAITTSEAFGFGVEHVADGIIRFRRSIRNGVLRRYVLIEKMRQTNHSLIMHELRIMPGKGIVILKPTSIRREDLALPKDVKDKVVKAKLSTEAEVPKK
jgi:KaiC domain protein